MGCPSDETVAALGEGRLDDREAAEVHAHVDGCPSCQWLLSELAAAASVDPAPPAAPPDAAPIVLTPGSVVGGRYRLERMLGHGGMGTVWSALHVGTDRRVALKVLRQERGATPTARLRFLREARLLGRLDHPHLVPVRDVFEEGATPILAMDLLAGESLGDRLRREGALPLDRVARLLLGALEAIDAAHAAGIVHRDLKPDNLFLVASPGGGEPSIRVLDFGVAKLLAGEAQPVTALTAAGEVLGTPPYMSPEQLRGEPTIDRRTDVWAFGVILYECLSGRRPFAAAHLFQYVERVTAGAREPLATAAPGLPADVVALVEKMLTVDAGARSADLKEAIAVLRGHAAERGGSRRVLGWAALALVLAGVGAGAWWHRAHLRPAPIERAGAPAPADPVPAPAQAPAVAPAAAAAAAPGSPCERAWGDPVGGRICRTPILAMREAAWRTGAELAAGGADEPLRARLAAERSALAADLASCGAAEPCLLARLQAAAPRTGVVDCGHAVSRDARAICRSVPLAELAGSLAAHYQLDRALYEAHHRSLPKGIPPPAVFSSDQTAWLLLRHRCGDDEACLRQRFDERIAELTRIRRAFATRR